MKRNKNNLTGTKAIAALSALFLLCFSNTQIAAADATSTPPLPTVAQTEAQVREFFAADPIMITIAKCESGFRQFTDSGKPFMGSGRYVGIFQIDENIHAAFAKSLGMDIYTVEGNMAFAQYLKNSSGTRPWPTCSKLGSPASAILTLTLKSGMENSQIKTVQQLLNGLGFILAETGPGSPGQETAYFGALTRAAIKKFQCAKNIVCSGSEATTGYGLVGPRTRAALLSAAK